MGDTVLLREHGALSGFALCHSAPLVEGRSREELRVLKLVLADADDFERMVPLLAELARRTGTSRVSLRLQGEYGRLFQRSLALGARVRWTDLRMALAGYEEPALLTSGVVLSNWEI